MQLLTFTQIARMRPISSRSNALNNIRYVFIDTMRVEILCLALGGNQGLCCQIDDVSKTPRYDQIVLVKRRKQLQTQIQFKQTEYDVS
jgi:hypothetical protein